MLRFYLRNTLLSPAMIVGIIGLLSSMLVGMNFHDDLLYCYQYTISLGVTSFFIPVATVLPVCFMQKQMNAGNNIRYICLMRSSRRSFSGSALLSAVLSGMLIMFGAFLLFTAFCSINSVGHPYFGKGMFSYQTVFYDALSEYPGMLYLLMGAVFTLNGAIWPAISLLCFAFTSNQYLALAIPFVVRTGMGYLMQSTGWFYLDPSQLLLKGVANQLPGGGIPYVLLYSAVVVLFCGFFWNYSIKRRLHHG